jgi:hypothetical protein
MRVNQKLKARGFVLNFLSLVFPVCQEGSSQKLISDSPQKDHSQIQPSRERSYPSPGNYPRLELGTSLLCQGSRSSSKSFGCTIRREDPLGSSPRNRSQGISVVAYATLISWLQGSQYTLGGSHHQIKTHPPSRYMSLGPLTFALAVLPFLADTGQMGWYPPSSASTLDRLSSIEKMKTIRQILRDQGIVKKDDYPLPWSKGDQETFRRGAMVRAETPKHEQRFRRWDSRRSYSEHP